MSDQDKKTGVPMVRCEKEGCSERATFHVEDVDCQVTLHFCKVHAEVYSANQKEQLKHLEEFKRQFNDLQMSKFRRELD